MGSMKVSSCRCCLFASCVHLVAVLNYECNVISLYFMCFSVNGSVCLDCCAFVNCLVKQFAIFWVWLLFCC